MTKHRIYIVLALGLLVIAAIWPWSRPQVRSSSPTAQQAQSPSPTPQSSANEQTTPLLWTRPSEDVLSQNTGQRERAKQEQEKVVSGCFQHAHQLLGKSRG